MRAYVSQAYDNCRTHRYWPAPVLVAGAVIAGATSASPGCHDEGCWLPQLTAGSSLGAVGSALLLTAGILQATSVHDAEVR